MKNTITLVLILFLSGIVHSQIILPEDGSCGKYFAYDNAGIEYNDISAIASFLFISLVKMKVH